MRTPLIGPARLGCGLALGLALLAAGCGNDVVMTPGDVASNYVYAVAEGNSAKACSSFTPAAQAALGRAGRPRSTCAAVITRCVPARYRHSSGDQSQLLYASTVVTIRGARATVVLSQTPAADAVHSVNEIHTSRGWRLTSPGRVIDRCVAAERRRHRHRHG